MTAELSRPVAVSQCRREGLTVVVRATPEECAAVAIRMDLPAIQSLECVFNLTAEPDGVSVLANGHLRAEVTRICIASAEEFATPVDEAFLIRFVPEGAECEDPDPDLPDEIPYEGDTIDLGEATAEQLGLALDPYPRMDGATVPVIDEDDDISPFAVLAQRMPPGRTGQ